MTKQNKLTRRALGAAVGGTALAALGASTLADHMKKQPTVFLPHGGGPFSYVDMGVPEAEVSALVDYWRAVGRKKPKATLVISAHWEEDVPTVMSAQRPPMLYDYFGFPKASYEIQWPAPGDPELAARVRALLDAAGFTSALDDKRGFDHGTFVPMGRVFPDADVPCVQLSLMKSLDPSAHLALGRALAPLRDEGVLIVGSGMSYHDLRGFRSRDADRHADAFDAWLQRTARASPQEREARLIDWERAPSSRAAHPREEHLLPLMVVAGAALDDEGHVPFAGKVFGKSVSAVHFG